MDTHKLDGLISAYKGLGDAMAGPEGSEVLVNAGNRLSEHLRFEVARRGMVKTGQLFDSIKPTGIKAEGTLGKYLDVYPQGTRRDRRRGKAVRNAEVGFVQEYGTRRAPPKKSTPATHWMSNTVDDVGEDILDTMQQDINNIIDKYLGGNE